MTFFNFSLLFLTINLMTSCAQNPVKKYQSLLEPRVGKATQKEINSILGNPASCHPEGKYEKCEYRSAYSRNNPVPDMFRKSKGIGLDLSPYEYFDVLHLYFDGFHVLQEWETVVIAH